MPLQSRLLTSGRLGCPNMGSLLSSFCLSGDVSYPQSYWSAELAPATATDPMTSLGPLLYPSFLGVPEVEKPSCGKPYCLYLMPQGAESYCVSHKCRGKCFLLRLRHRLHEFLDWEMQQLTFPSSFPGTTLFPARPFPTHLSSQSASAEQPECCLELQFNDTARLYLKLGSAKNFLTKS